MAILLKNASELDKMYRAGQLLCEVLDTVEALVVPGVTTKDLDDRAEALLLERGAVAAFKGYEGFPSVLCTSVNEAVVHGIPSSEVVLSEGDVVSIDCGLVLDGFFADSARTVSVGSVDPEVTHLLDVTRSALAKGIARCKSGGRVGNIGAAIQREVEAEGLSVVRDYSGHGIGRSLHEEPSVPNYGKAGRGMKLMPGLVLAIEPMVNLGDDGCELLEDDWTVVTADRSVSAHFEHTVAITSKGPWVLTQRT
jgi:methionyl aminopeptidase